MIIYCYSNINPLSCLTGFIQDHTFHPVLILITYINIFYKKKAQFFTGIMTRVSFVFLYHNFVTFLKCCICFTLNGKRSNFPNNW